MAIDDEKAATQYGDLRGTISIDGFDGPFLNAIRAHSSMPSGFDPVGMALNLQQCDTKDRNADKVKFTLYGADVNVVGTGPDDWRKYVMTNGEIGVFEFEANVPLHQVVKMIKRLSIKVWHKALDEPRVRVLEDG